MFIRAPRTAQQEADGPGAASAGLAEEELFELLRRLRKRLANKRGVPPYVVFSDRTLRELARVKPVTLAEMREVTGVGAAKLRDYGEEFIIRIEQYLNPSQPGQKRRKRATD
jgi:ATP-dependent DNA helicase RecQ